jgi:16S rRNA pseudouridine516 synthase
MERLDKILSHHGYGSRKDVKKLIHSGAIKINGKECFSTDFHVDTQKDIIQIDDKILEIKRNVYIMMNKCADVVCANKDGLHKTVFDLLDDKYKIEYLGGIIHNVGRLDIDTEGLLIMTTDGELTHKLISPKNKIPKKYFVKLKNAVSEKEAALYREKFASGLKIEPEGNESGFIAEHALLEMSDSQSAFLTITEGKFHQVKRMFKAVGNEVVYLKRVSEGKLQLDTNLLPGEYRELTPAEIELLKH